MPRVFPLKPRLLNVSPIPASRASKTLGILLLVLAAVPATAQFQQYTPPGQNRSAGGDLREALEQDVDNARWRLGALRLEPQVVVRNFAYVNDVFVGTGEEVSDVTAAVGAGLTAYLPVGPKSTIVAFALPEYVWWQEQDLRRRWNQSFGAGIFSYFNRLTVEAGAARQENQGFASSEVEQLVTTKTEDLDASVAVRVARSLWLEGSFQTTKLHFLSDEEREDLRIARFDTLDREEDVLRAGLRVDLRGDWTLGVGVERSEVSFLDPGNDLSNSGTAPYVEMERSGDGTKVAFDLAFRSLEPEGTSTFEPLDDVTGSAEIVFHLRPTLDLAVTGSRQLLYSVSEDFSYSLSQRTGLELRKEIRRTKLDLFYEVGDLEFAAADSRGLRRVDDYVGWGGRIELALWARTSLEVGATVTDYQSNLPGFDRSVTRWTTSLSIGDTAWP
jgi:hypothetical protein